MMSTTLAGLSESVTALVATFTPLICAVRIDAERHATGLLVQGGAILTPNRFLPALDFYTGVFANSTLVSATRAMRDPISDIALIGLDTPLPAKPLNTLVPPVGTLLLLLSAAADGAPCARLSLVSRQIRTSLGIAPAVDAAGLEPGTLLIDGHGRLAGMASVDAQGQPAIIPVASLHRFVAGDTAPPAKPPTAPAAAAPLPAPPRTQRPAPALPATAQPRRAWLGVSLQPITIPDALVPRAGQGSGRMVVSLVDGGPADIAGLEIGDVLLTLNGTSVSGTHGMRDFLTTERIGTRLEIRLLRNGALATATLVVGANPD